MMFSRRKGMMSSVRKNAWLTASRISTCFILVSATLLFTGCEEDADVRADVRDYDEAALLEARGEKDNAFRSSGDSPIPADKRSSFTGLRFYEPSAEYFVNASVAWHTPADTVVIGTTMGGDERKALRVATLSFSLNGHSSNLTAFKFINTPAEYEDILFVPFRDATNGYATYEAGRYLDIPIVMGDDSVAIDFNTAYHPFCLYNSAYSCPLPPPENNLRYKVEAGEKK